MRASLAGIRHIAGTNASTQHLNFEKISLDIMRYDTSNFCHRFPLCLTCLFCAWSNIGPHTIVRLCTGEYVVNLLLNCTILYPVCYSTVINGHRSQRRTSRARARQRAVSRVRTIHWQIAREESDRCQAARARICFTRAFPVTQRGTAPRARSAEENDGPRRAAALPQSQSFAT